MDEIKQEIAEFKCKYCGISYTSRQNLDNHVKICRTKIVVTERDIAAEYMQNRLQSQEVENKMLRERIAVQDAENRELKEKMESMVKERIDALEALVKEKEKAQERVSLAAVSRPTSSNTITSTRNTIKSLRIIQLTPVSCEEIDESIQFLTKEHVEKGAEGFAQYASEYALKDKFVVTDLSRMKLAWKDETGETVYDVGGVRLSQKFFSTIKYASYRLLEEVIGDARKELRKLDSSASLAEIKAREQRCAEVRDQLAVMNTIECSGKKEMELKNAFVKHLCALDKGLPVPGLPTLPVQENLVQNDPIISTSTPSA